MTSRLTRSRTRQQEDSRQDESRAPTGAQLRTTDFLKLSSASSNPRLLSAQELDVQLSRLPKKDLALLRLKQQKLQDSNAQVSVFIRERQASTREKDVLLAQAAAATLVFAWEAAGTAVCISPAGLLITCSHCIAETEDDYHSDTERWLLFASGNAVTARCVAWDPVRDLALLQVTSTAACKFSYVRLAETRPAARSAMVCVGHPGSEDFEAERSGVATGYDVLHISEGYSRGLAKGQDPQDNSEIGALKHDCWTYWGHSGAPLLSKTSGQLLGLHSSWDDETAMRRGIAWEALTAFLEEHTTRCDISRDDA